MPAGKNGKIFVLAMNEHSEIWWADVTHLFNPDLEDPRPVKVIELDPNTTTWTGTIEFDHDTIDYDDEEDPEPQHGQEEK